MPNKDIYQIRIVRSNKNTYWYKNLIGNEFYTVAQYDINGNIMWEVINIRGLKSRTIDFNDAEILHKITKVEIDYG